MKLPPPVQRVIEELSKLPSIGPRQAIRLAFYMIGQNKGDLKTFAQAVDGLTSIKTCEQCFFIHQNPDNLCDICRNPQRKQGVIMVIEKETDYLSLEDTKKFTGRYFIIGPIAKTGFLEPWQKLRLQSLTSFIKKSLNGQADEIVLAFNPTSLGDFQASLLTKELSPLAKKISRLGRGLPTGGEIEFADDETLGSALERRS
ncbi:MAG TPA: toprim domain-containing protein [Candidatus Paceibacterota bacterium]|nr:toprim domain-containing protein [Candidatus Paceibacterota bacterium]